VLAFLGIEATDAQRDAAIEAASVDNMRAIEARRRGGVDHADAYFYRGGASRQAAHVLPDAVRERFSEVSGPALALVRAVATPGPTLSGS
jgi:hypothetical protein